MENKNRLLTYGGDSRQDLDLETIQDDDLETILKDIAKLTRFNGNPLRIEELSKHLLFNRIVSLKTYNLIKFICEWGSGP